MLFRKKIRGFPGVENEADLARPRLARRRARNARWRRVLALSWAGITVAAATGFADWPSWRGAEQTGASREAGLISSWTVDGAGQLWRADFIGRSTPVIFDGRVCAVGRSGDGVSKRERVSCFDTASGDLIWDHRFNVFHTTIPFNRVGWASPAFDPETGNLYAHGVQGLLLCYGKRGDILWQRSLTEEFGRISGYGGRIHTPVVDGDLVIVSYLNRSWGDHRIPRHRYFAFDKYTGEVVWIATPGGRPLDTTYSTPVVADIDGARLLIAGNADGGIYGMKVTTGEKVWGFALSKRGINASVVVEGTRVYAAHSEENVDGTVMGRVVCIDATGSGDVTATHELWRYDGCQVGYASPVVHEGRVYAVDNSANLHCLNADNGELMWTHNVGTVGRGSPVWADGKLYVTEVNGSIQILEPDDKACSVLDSDTIRMPDGGPAEIFGSPAVADGLVYVATEAGLLCLGEGGRERSSTSLQWRVSTRRQAPRIQLVPAEVSIAPGDSVRFSVNAFNQKGRKVASSAATKWEMEGLSGTLVDGLFATEAESGQVGLVRVRVGGGGGGNDGRLESTARVRVVPHGSWSEDFESMSVEEGSNAAPGHWIGAGGKFVVRQLDDGNKVFVKTLAKRGLQRSNVFLGEPDMSGYSIQIDLMGSKAKRNRPDMGLIANRYTLDMMGNHQQLQIRSWAAELRMATQVPFEWETEVWYRMKMTIADDKGKAVVKGKVWKRADPEPQGWTITAEDPFPNREGSPGLYGYSAAEISYDNLIVTVAEK